MCSSNPCVRRARRRYSTIDGFEQVVLTTDRNEEGFIAIVLLTPPAGDEPLFEEGDWLAQKAQARLQCLVKLRAHAKAANRAPHEVPVGVLPVAPTATNPRPWRQGNGLLTITGKVNRLKVKDTYHLEWMAEYSNRFPDSPPVSSGGGGGGGGRGGVGGDIGGDRSAEDNSSASGSGTVLPPTPSGSVRHTKKRALQSEEGHKVLELTQQFESRAEREIGPAPQNADPIVVRGCVCTVSYTHLTLPTIYSV